MFSGYAFTVLCSRITIHIPKFVASLILQRNHSDKKNFFNTKITNQLFNCLFFMLWKIPPSHEKVVYSLVLWFSNWFTPAFLEGYQWSYHNIQFSRSQAVSFASELNNIYLASFTSSSIHYSFGWKRWTTKHDQQLSFPGNDYFRHGNKFITGMLIAAGYFQDTMSVDTFF